MYEYTIAELSILEERQLDEDNGSVGAPLLFTSVSYEYTKQVWKIAPFDIR